MDRPRSVIQQSSSSGSSVKIGGLWKRSQGLSRFTKANYKHRVFILTEQALSYYSGTVDRVGQQKRRVPLDSVRAVEFVDETAFKLAHSYQIIYVSKKHGFVTLYVTATDSVECSEWVATLRQACYFNRDMLMHYHPGAMLKGKWSCCKHRERATLGCQPTYHLLTRSSSRYAAIRRRDTLTSSTNSKRRSVGSTHSNRYGTYDRRATTTNVPYEMHTNTTPGQGLSNSCVDLTLHRAAHHPDAFLVHDTALSQCSSRLSTEPSVSLASITLNRVSVAETSVSEFDCNESKIDSPKTSSKFRRCQVAPETSSNGVMGHFPLEVEPRSLVSKYKAASERPRGKSLDTQMMSSIQRSTAVKDSIQTYTLPRQKKLKTASPLTGSVQCISLVQPQPTVEIQSPNKSNKRLKHSNTFVSNSAPTMNAKLQDAVLKSNSLSTLTKPVIEPKVSLSNPNVIHV